ncbi:MAG: nitrate/nitrite transporter NrtS [Acidimicrobiales bacterium]
MPPWRTPGQAISLILRGVTFPTASRVSAIVGTLLSAVNQGSVILSRDATPITALRVAVNYIVPYTVASVGYLAPFRQERPRR